MTVKLALRLIDIARIEPYERGPRRAPNPEFRRLKASIRHRGLTQPLTVTQRPGASSYVLWAGGATRLRIVKELFAETGSPGYGTVPCVLQSWRGEANLLLAHLGENDMRGALTFIDLALSVSEAASLLEREAKNSRSDQLSVMERFAERGHPLSAVMFSEMRYAVDRLLTLLPQALNSGMGRSEVVNIRDLDQAAKGLWLDRSVDTEPEYEAVFAALCRRYDGAAWHLDFLRRALEVEMAERGEGGVHAISFELEERLTGKLRGPSATTILPSVTKAGRLGAQDRGGEGLARPAR